MTLGSSKQNIIAGQYQCIGYESITVNASAQSLNANTYTDSDGHVAKKAVITVEDAQIRYRYDGTDPTTSDGHLINPFTVITLLGSPNIKNFRAIRATGTNATIKVSYEL